jgi:demethylmenaquinone methyltransferase/2-methoxy-6-polyprenyl-1,4-benzoquinol methylase
MGSTDTALTAYYAARAREYERIYDKSERQSDLARLRELIPGYFGGRTVLEIACGTGYWTQRIAAVARRVTAVDINPETLEIARSKELGGTPVEFIVADVRQLPAACTGFSGAFAGFWWSHMVRGDRRGFVESLHRALEPGAVVVALDNRYVEGSSTPVAFVDAEGNSFQRRRLDDGSEHVVLKNFPTEDELRHDVRGLGREIEYTALEHYWVFKYEVARESS